jgi:hypothetical protein
MFALPPHHSAHDSLASHVFGRFADEHFALQQAAVTVVGQPSMAVDNGMGSDDAFPDLAQRVREIGEW